MEAIAQKIDLNAIPEKDMVNHLRSIDYLVIPANGEAHENKDLLDALEHEGYTIVSGTEYIEDYIHEGEAKVRLTGSMIDTEVEEIIAELHAKHGYNLANILRSIC